MHKLGKQTGQKTTEFSSQHTGDHEIKLLQMTYSSLDYFEVFLTLAIVAE